MAEAILFDLDGTLFDDRQYIRGGLRNASSVLAARTGVDLTDELLDAYFERGCTESTFDTVLNEHGLSTELVSELVDTYHDNHADLWPFPDTVPVLDALTDSCRLGVITGGTNGRAKLDRLGLTDYFEIVYVTTERDSSKRSPAVFESALDAFDVSPTAAIYVGDRPALDFPQPNRLGMTTVRIVRGRYANADATGDARPDYAVDGLDELLALADV
ncbi:HAD-IA family hydrolase [Halohasta salina]|uniref:HAD-IA family hydrolase n=1 Tax=Halohasta salina TaxID=2961621 RepID=UPI0020A45E00|nr:HAD-IA family hydrolase [Halohasta salina]